MRKNLRRSLGAVIVTIMASSAMLFTGSVAYAEETGEESVADAVGFSPAGCVGRSNNPHKDTYGRIKGVTQIDCYYSVPQLRTTAQLWRKRWWGYEKVGTKGNITNYKTWQVKASGIFYGCQNNRWRTEGEHWSWEGGRTYYAHTMRYADVTTC